MSRTADNIVEVKGALILGAGLAGLFTALKLAPYPSLVLTGARVGHSGSSVWAQGGIAAAVAPGDTWESHAADTVAAGAGLSDPAMAALLARDASARIDDLLRLGVPFDRDVNGALAVGLEAAHSRARIVHVRGDSTGVAITRALAAAAKATAAIQFADGFHAIELGLADGRVVGLFARTGVGAAARLILFRAPAVIFATGGLGALYAVTTNPPESRGEGLGMAARAGAVIADPEFVQFHPTAIAVGRDPAPLATEALRGAGAILINERGERFMQSVHANAELAPRNIVARAIHHELAGGGRVFLDCRDALGSAFPTRFPTVYAAAMAADIDPMRDAIPVAPAAHYHMGGIATDANGRSSLNGLWAVGECACTGVHGANRLASNSLLEALVFGGRAADDIRNALPASTAHVRMPAPDRWEATPAPRMLREAMSMNVGIERDAAGLARALNTIAAVERAGAGEPALLNMTAAARLVAAAALARHESRGAHFRADYPQAREPATRTFLTLADSERVFPPPFAGEVSSERLASETKGGGSDRSSPRPAAKQFVTDDRNRPDGLVAGHPPRKRGEK
jgi:L-aspartate oxidase